MLPEYYNGIQDPQEGAKEVAECACCGGEIYEGERLVIYENDTFCEEKCMLDHAVDYDVVN